MNKKTFAICNLGCKVNNYEANWYQSQLSLKYDEVDFKEKADIYIINSCTVTNMANSKTRQMIHKARRQNEDACIVCVSCYAQMEYKDQEAFKDVDILIGSRYKTRLPQMVDEYLNNHQKINIVDDFDTTSFEEMFIPFFNQTRAYLKIQDGCNQFCGYCTIPLARGRERSLDSDKVLKQAEQLVASGHNEIVLTGIHTGRYNDGKLNLTQLMQLLLNNIADLKRIRLSSIEMTEVSDELIALMKNDERVARHLHIPLQVGNDELLKINNRPYTAQEYLERINYIVSEIPDVSISSDVIVGLPCESEEMFMDTYRFIENSPLSFLHVFPYARKKHTKDYDLPQVDEIAKKQRDSQLIELSHKKAETFYKQFIGKSVDVLFETYDGKLLKGHSSQYLNVVAESAIDYRGQFKKVIVKEYHNSQLISEIQE